MIQDETQVVPRSMPTQKDQKPEEVQISFSPYLKSRTDKTEVQTKMQTKFGDSR